MCGNHFSEASNRQQRAVSSDLLSVIKNLILLTVFSLLFSVDGASALPWDIDMYRQQSFQPWELPRAPVKGTVPMGYKPITMTADEMDEKLKNPTTADFNSVWRGKRLYDINCYTCHGTLGDGKGPIGKTGVIPVPNLLDNFYINRTDGRIYGVLHYGGAAMPRYGYKFSEQEHWDVINYVRLLQGKVKVPGMELPQQYSPKHSPK